MIAEPEFNPLLELTAGTLGLVVVIIVHGTGVRWISRYSSREWIHVAASPSHLRVNLHFARVIGALATLHLFETLLWALPIRGYGLLSLRDAYYLVLGAYTTIGSGLVRLPEQWRLLAPIIAMSGLFTFGLTGSVLVAIMVDLGRIDRSTASREERDPMKVSQPGE